MGSIYELGRQSTQIAEGVHVVPFKGNGHVEAAIRRCERECPLFPLALCLSYLPNGNVHDGITHTATIFVGEARSLPPCMR